MPFHRSCLGTVLLAAALWAGETPTLACAAAAEPEIVGLLALAIENDVADAIGLTEGQRAKLLEIIEARENEALELAVQLKNLSAPERAAKLLPFRRESESKGLAVLSKQQRARLQQICAARWGAVGLIDAELANQLKLSPAEQVQAAELLRQEIEQLGRADPKTAETVRAETERKLAALLGPERHAAVQRIVAASRGSEGGAAGAIKVQAPVASGGGGGPGSGGASAPPQHASTGSSPSPSDAPQPKKPDELEDLLDLMAEEFGEEALFAETEVLKPSGRLRFNFRYAPWKDVLEWFAEQADLSLIADAPPKGTFNYVDTRDYTPAEAIDLLNSVLLTKGFTLVRRDRMLILINLEDGIPPNLVATVPLEEIDKRGEYELISVLFQLQNVTPEEAEQEIRKLIGPQGSVVVLPKARQVFVTETAGRLRTIRRVIESIEKPEESINAQVYPIELKYAEPQDVLALVRQLLDIPTDRNSSADGSIHIAVESSTGRLLVTGKPEAVARVQEVVKAVDVPDPANPQKTRLSGTPQLEVYPITAADPNSVMAVLQTVLAGLPDVRLAIDPKTGNLIAQARPAQHKTIRATLDQLQRDARRLDVIPLRTLDPQLAVAALTKLFASEVGAGAPKIDADPISRQLLVRGSEAQIEQIRKMLEQMGETLSTDGRLGSGNVRVLPIPGRAGRMALERLQEIWPTVRQNRIRVVTPSTGIATYRPSSEEQEPGPALPADQQPEIPTPEEFLEQLERAVEEDRAPEGGAGAGAHSQLPGASGIRRSSTRGSPTAPPTPPTSPESSPASESEPKATASKTTAQADGRESNRLRVIFATETIVADVPEQSPALAARPGASAPSASQTSQVQSTPGASVQSESKPSPGPTVPGSPATPASPATSGAPATARGPGLPASAASASSPGSPGSPGSRGPVSSAGGPASSTSPGSPPADAAAKPDPAAKAATGDAKTHDVARSNPGAGTKPDPVITTKVAPELPAVSAPSPPAIPSPAAGVGKPSPLPPKADAPPAGGEQPAGKTAAHTKPPAPIIVAPGPTGLVIASEDTKALDEFEQLLTMLGSGLVSGKPELTIFYLKHAKADAVAETLDQVFGGGTLAADTGGGRSLLGDLAGAALGDAGGGLVSALLGGGGGSTARPTGPIQITPDSRLNALIVRANPVDLDTIEQLLKILDQPESPEEILAAPKPRLIPVYNTLAEEIANVIRQVYQDRMVTGPGGPQRMPSPQEFLMMLRGGRGSRGGGSRRSAQEETPKMSIGVDARTNSLVVVAPDALFREVKELVEQLDQAAGDSDETVQVVTLHNTSSDALQRALASMMGGSVQVNRSGTSPSGSGPSFSGGFPSFWSRRSRFSGFGGSSGFPGGSPFSGPGPSPFGFPGGGPPGSGPTPGMTPGMPFGPFGPFGGGPPGMAPGSSSQFRPSSRSSSISPRFGGSSRVGGFPGRSGGSSSSRSSSGRSSGSRGSSAGSRGR